MKLLFVVPEFPPQFGGGIITFYGALLPAIQRRGHEVHVLVGSATTDTLPPYMYEGVSVTSLEHMRFREYLPRFAAYAATPIIQRWLAAAWAIYGQVNGGLGYDLVEVCDWGLQHVPWTVAQDAPPTVVQLHGTSGQIAHYDPQEGTELEAIVTQLLETATLARADAIHASSHLNAREWETRLAREVCVIPPALGVTLLDAPSVRGSDGVVVARVQYWKGPTVLCEALQLLAQRPQIEWIGRDMPYREHGQSMSSYLECEYPDIWGSSIRWISGLSPREVAQRQAAARFSVVPSVWDVFNYAGAEAMLAGTPVVCSDGAGVSDLIEPGVNGFVFRSGDASQLAELLDRVVALSDEALHDVGQAGQESVRALLCPDRVAELKLDAYAAALAQLHQTAPDTWLLRACLPDATRNPLAFLDALPLQDLASYCTRRLSRKLARRSA